MHACRAGFSGAGRFQAGLWRRNLAPIVGDGGFLCCAAPLRDASLHNLVSHEAIRAYMRGRAGLISTMAQMLRFTFLAPPVLGMALILVLETHGAWQVSCRTPPGAKEEKCALVQSVTAEDRPNVGLTVVFYKAIGEDKKLLRVVVPLGVLLPTGLGLKIDGADVGNAPFLKCGKRGCVAEVVLQDEVIAKMKKGTTAMFIIFDTPEAGIGIPVALQGFGDALANLK